MSKPDPRRFKSCGGKRRHGTMLHAQAALASLLRTRQKQGNPIVSVMRCYGCACGGFHVGSSKQIDWRRVK